MTKRNQSSDQDVADSIAMEEKPLAPLQGGRTVDPKTIPDAPARPPVADAGPFYPTYPDDKAAAAEWRARSEGAENIAAPGVPLSVGQIVLYALSVIDVDNIARRRSSVGNMHHLGSGILGGHVFPMIVVRVNVPAPHDGIQDPTSVNGQVFLDGDDTYWVQLATQVPTDITEDQKSGHWFTSPV